VEKISPFYKASIVEISKPQKDTHTKKPQTDIPEEEM
jgi:hypothetical protein